MAIEAEMGEVKADGGNAHSLSDPESTENNSMVGEKQSDAQITDATDDNEKLLSGWRLHGVTFALSLSLFLSTLEISIVSTALVAISNDLQSFSQSSWIVSSYLLTYTGFIIIWAKFSDILGRRQCMTAALVVFMIASGACGGAQTTNQLIVFRAFQGIGGSGILSLVFVIIPEMVDEKRYAKYAAITACTYAISYLIGPLVGGAICDGTTWRWIFLLNLPGSVLALGLLLVAMPAGFPCHGSAKTEKKIFDKRIFMTILSRIDFMGAVLLFGSSSCLVAALQQAGTQYAWSSAVIIVLLVLAALLWVGFLAWEYMLDRGNFKQEPVFTMRLMRQRVYIGGVIVTLLAGMPYTVAIIQIPQRFQAINNVTALQAGIRLLPFTLCASIGTIAANVLSSRLRVPILGILLAGAILQTVAAALMSTLDVDAVPEIYGYEALLSLGIGFNIGMLVQSTPQLIRGKDQSVAMGALNQFRALGGVIGLSIATNALYSHVRSALAEILSPQQLDALLQSARTFETLPKPLRDRVNSIFSEGYNLQMRIMIGFAAAQILVIAMMWEKKPRRVV